MEEVDNKQRSTVLNRALVLECGVTLSGVCLAWKSWGRLNRQGDNAVVVCHALTGSAAVDEWWPGILGPGRALDPDRDFIICINVPGGCYGSTGPATEHADNRPWGGDFPALTIRDMVQAQALLLEQLGVARIRLVVGGSMGGMQVLEWAAMYPERIDTAIPIAVGADHSGWCLAWSENQRQAIRLDPAFRNGRYLTQAPPDRGLALARQIAMSTYRSPAEFRQRFGRNRGGAGMYEMTSYLHHQGRKLVRRFDANSYLTLLDAMDSHDLARNRGDMSSVLQEIQVPMLVIGIDSDQLYRPEEQTSLASQLGHAELGWIRSVHGHDAFLIETDQVERMIRRFRRARETAGSGEVVNG